MFVPALLETTNDEYLIEIKSNAVHEIRLIFNVNGNWVKMGIFLIFPVNEIVNIRFLEYFYLEKSSQLTCQRKLQGYCFVVSFYPWNC